MTVMRFELNAFMSHIENLYRHKEEKPTVIRFTSAAAPKLRCRLEGTSRENAIESFEVIVRKFISVFK